MDYAFSITTRQLGAALVCLMLGAAGAAHAHDQTKTSGKPLVRCTTAGPLSDKALQDSEIWKRVIAPLRVNRNQAKPCFGISDTPAWTAVVSRIPADVVAVQTSEDRSSAIVYVSGIPDYPMETPKVFASFKPGQTYGIFRISAVPTADDRAVHDFADKGAIGIFVNGVSIFNYTDTFAYNNKGVWSYDANVAEALIVNADVSHATPSNVPNFPKSRGIFHNHQMSVELLEELKDPYFQGKTAHSKLVGFAIDANPIYGPLGYASKDKSSGLKVLKSSYVQRSWQQTGHRSSIPEWVVANWDGSNRRGAKLLNLFGKPKAEILYAGGATDGDDKLAAEIKALSAGPGLKRDEQGYIYWENSVRLPDGRTVAAKNYLLKQSDLWGPDFGAEILPASYQIADVDKFYFKARVGAFAEDYEFVPGYGDLDFHNGIDSWLPERQASAYHYVATFSGRVTDRNRLKTAAFPYFVGVQYKSRIDPFNDSLDASARTKFFSENGDRLNTVFDLGIVGKDEKGQIQRAPVPETWRRKMTED